MLLLLNLLFAFLAFFAIRWGGNEVVPEGEDKKKMITVVAVIVAVVVFLANFAARVITQV